MQIREKFCQGFKGEQFFCSRIDCSLTCRIKTSSSGIRKSNERQEEPLGVKGLNTGGRFPFTDLGLQPEIYSLPLKSPAWCGKQPGCFGSAVKTALSRLPHAPPPPTRPPAAPRCRVLPLAQSLRIRA